MKKWLSRLLLVILVFSLSIGDTNITAKAAEKTQNVQEQEKETKLTQEEIEEKNEESNLSANYNILHADQVKASNYSNGRLSAPNIANASAENSLTNKQINMIVMLIDFPTSDSDPNKGKVTTNKTYSDEQIATLNSAFYGKSRSLTNYISTVSGGRASVNPVLTYKNNSEGEIYVYTADHPLGYYLPYSSSNPIGYKNDYYFDRTQLFTNAFAALKKYIPSDLDLDVDDDGWIDSIDFFTSYRGSWNDFLWSHSWIVCDQSQTANGARLACYNQITYPNNDTDVYKTITHEYMHTLGFPDQYIYDANEVPFANPFNSWTPMTYGNTGYPTVWERYKYGYNWIAESGIKEVTTSGTYTLKGSTTDSSVNTVAYKIKIPYSDEFFMIEYRDRSANVYESDMSGSGIIVYRVNPYRIGNSYGDPELFQIRNPGQRCDIAYLDGTSGHKSLELKDYDGNSMGTVECTGISDGQASFKIEKNQVTIYYKGYSSPYIHYKVGSGTWTKAPGVKMDTSNDVDGFTHVASIDLGSSSKLTACFNNGKGSWDNNNNKNYTFTAGYYTLKNGVITKIDKPVKVEAKTVIYYKGYSNPYIHYKVGSGTWTKAPGVKMDSSNDVDGYTHMIEIDLGDANNITACFNNGKGSWDNNYRKNYTFGKGYYTFSNGTIKKIEKPSSELRMKSITIYYKGYNNAYIHYKIGNGSWTSVPGVAMTKTSEKAGYTHKITIDLGDATNITACFNNGNGSWDSNNGNNYHFNGAGTYTYSNGNINKIS